MLVFTLSPRWYRQTPSRTNLTFSGCLPVDQRRTLFLEITCKANFAIEGNSLNCSESAKRLRSKSVNRGTCSKPIRPWRRLFCGGSEVCLEGEALAHHCSLCLCPQGSLNQIGRGFMLLEEAGLKPNLGSYTSALECMGRNPDCSPQVVSRCGCLTHVHTYTHMHTHTREAP